MHSIMAYLKMEKILLKLYSWFGNKTQDWNQRLIFINHSVKLFNKYCLTNAIEKDNWQYALSNFDLDLYQEYYMRINFRSKKSKDYAHLTNPASYIYVCLKPYIIYWLHKPFMINDLCMDNENPNSNCVNKSF